MWDEILEEIRNRRERIDWVETLNKDLENYIPTQDVRVVEDYDVLGDYEVTQQYWVGEDGEGVWVDMYVNYLEEYD